MTTSSISPTETAPRRPRAPRVFSGRFSMDYWAVVAAVVFIVLVVAGIFPRVPW